MSLSSSTQLKYYDCSCRNHILLFCFVGLVIKKSVAVVEYSIRYIHIIHYTDNSSHDVTWSALQVIAFHDVNIGRLYVPNKEKNMQLLAK